jgi:hypothetical protein
MVGRVYPTEIRPSLTRMTTEDIATVAAEAYEMVEISPLVGYKLTTIDESRREDRPGA